MIAPGLIYPDRNLKCRGQARSPYRTAERKSRRS
jgi:hypothetical protein